MAFEFPFFKKKKEEFPESPSKRSGADTSGVEREMAQRDVLAGTRGTAMPGRPGTSAGSSPEPFSTPGDSAGQGAGTPSAFEGRESGPFGHSAAPRTPKVADKDIELINAKLDSIKAILENLNRRIEELEKIARESQEEEYAY